MRTYHPNFPIIRILAALVALPVLAVAQTPTVTIQADQPGVTVSSNLFGIFFEEINFGGDGGLYGEMIRNRTFSGSSNTEFWTLVTTGTAAGQMRTDTLWPPNTNLVRSLKLTKTSGNGSVGAANGGYFVGLSIQSNATYNLSVYARGTNGFAANIGARLQNSTGSLVYTQAWFSGVTTNWQKFTASLTPSVTDTNASLVLSITNNSTVWLNVVSLFPQATFQSRTNGMRADLANMLAGVAPSFMRYPGGNFIEGNSISTAERWKNTIGDIATRPGHTNDAWGYWSTDGFGVLEYLLLCQDLGCQPLYAIYAGLSLGYNGATNNTVPLNQMAPYVQDALDLIQYCNGPTNSTWGAVRAANGHPAPFNLQYMEIGNENGGSYYNDRYALFYDAIKSNYPSMQLIVPDWGGTPTSRPFDIQDEHYYADPATFISYATKYDSYTRPGPKVFVGEYAVTSGYGTLGNLTAALAEAVFMTGLERNSDIVQMASYAPLFANVNGTQWNPDLINFDNYRVCGTPSYYVQQLFSGNRGDVVLPTVVNVPSIISNPPPQGAIGVGSWNTSVQYSNIVVTASNGATLYQSNFAANGTNGWQVYNGTWSATNGVYQQTALITDCWSTTGNTNWSNYTISLEARKVTGSEGFLVLFDWQDDNNFLWFNVGGWNNTLDGVEQTVNGTETLLGSQVSTDIPIQTNQWYNISIVLTGPFIQCYINGTLVEEVTNLTSVAGGLYASTTYNQSSNQIIVKAVNPYNSTLPTTFNLAGVGSMSSTATLLQLTSPNPANENSLATPTYVYPTTNTINNVGTNFTLNIPANSLSILRLQLQTPLPPSGFRAMASGWQVALSWASYNSATNYIIERATTSGGPYTTIGTTTGTSYVDTNVTPGDTYYYVLIAVMPTGQTPATHEVAVSVGATLWAYLPFDETSGTTAVDVTGNGWNGTLINGATWVAGYSNNAVGLNSAGNQYVSLPTGVVSNLTDFSICAWVNLASVSTWMRIFDFGSGTTTYMFLTPDSGSSTLRYAITTNSYGGEQQINDNSVLPINGWHHVAVTLAGNLGTLYLDGVSVGSNTAMTLTPVSLGGTTQNWIGRSQWAADPYLNGAVDEFRIYRGALSAGEVATFLNPLSPPMGLAANAGDGQVALSWNSSANADGYNVMYSTSNGGPYVLLATVSGTNYTDAAVINGVTYYFVVTATNTVGTSAASAQVSATPRPAFQAWQMNYFSSTNCAMCGPNADFDGVGMSNTNKFLGGFNPTNSAAYLHIISIVRTNNNTDIEVTYLGANGDTTYTGGPSSRTNVLEFAPGRADGSYSTAFASTGQTNILSGGTGLGVVTNMVDSGGATNVPSRFYRVRVLAP
jgi:alpha-L-arabinofuranosidase